MTLKSIYLNYNSDSACPYNRLLCPGMFCGPAFEAIGCSIEVGEGLPKGHDIYFFHGLPNEAGIVEIAKIKRRGGKFVWSVDDDWLTIPDWNPAKPSETGLAMYELALNLADAIVTSTPGLQKTFTERVSKPVFCCPNLMDISKFPDFPYREVDGVRLYDVEVDLPVRVAWVGGPTHKEDVEQMMEGLAYILYKHGPEKVAVIFQGMAPPPKLMTRFLHKGLFHQPSVPFASYQKILNSIKPNVYLAPLAPVEFNLSKSNLRIMEAWALMTAPVASPWGEYNCIRSGHDGRYASNPDEWCNTLNRLVTDHEYRLSLAVSGRERVEKEYSWQSPQCRKPWVEMFASVLEVPTPVE